MPLLRPAWSKRSSVRARAPARRPRCPIGIQLTWVRPNGAVVHSQGREPLDRRPAHPSSPAGATALPSEPALLSPLRGSPNDGRSVPGARAPGYGPPPRWGGKPLTGCLWGIAAASLALGLGLGIA